MRARAKRSNGPVVGALVAATVALVVASCGSNGFVPAAGAAGGAGGGAAPPAATQSVVRQGTIMARVDGQERTWFVVSQDLDDATRSSGVWFPSGTDERPDDRLVMIGGFDTEDVPLASFRRDRRGNVVDYGEYQGSLLSILVQVPSGVSSLRVRIPEERGVMHGLFYMPRASATDISQMYLAQKATIDVRSVTFDDGRAAIEGTFGGTFQAAQGSRVEITDGRLRVKTIPRFEATR